MERADSLVLGLVLKDNSRFMIDSTLGKACYRHNPEKPKELISELKDDLGPLAMNQTEPPGDKFLLTTPNFIWGFNMWDKAWSKYHYFQPSHILCFVKV